jgi:hypothetical protein
MYANRAIVKLWNSMKADGDPPIFCGWYWMVGHSEGGPFHSESAAMRDAWYRVVKGVAPPALFHSGGVVTPNVHYLVGERASPSYLTLPGDKLKSRGVGNA